MRLLDHLQKIIINDLASRGEVSDTGVSMQWFAMVYAFLGDRPDTVKWLERSAERHEWAALNIAINPIHAEMRHAPEFQALVKRIGLDR